MEIVFLVGRIFLGGYFLMAGLNHFKKTNMLAGYARSRGVKMARSSVLISGLFLLLGGAGLLLGVYTRLSIILLVVFLLIASFKTHNFWKDNDPKQKMSEMQNFLKNMAMIGALLIIYTIADWPLSIF